MKAKGWITLLALLNEYHPNDVEAILEFLPESERSSSEAFQTTAVGLSEHVLEPECFLHHIHYGWISQTVEALPEDLQQLFLNVFNEERGKKISKKLGLKYRQQNLSERVVKFLRRHAYALLCKKELMPPQFIPQTALSPLINLSQEQLVELVALVGLYDIANEFNSSINQKLLNTAYSMMNERQRDYISLIVKKKKFSKTEPPVLTAVTESQKKMQHFLQRRGLMKLGTSCANQHPDFMWYLTRIFDPKRAEVLTRYVENEEELSYLLASEQQVADTMEYLNI